MNPCLLIPIYNHGATVGAVIEGLAPLKLPCLVIDDGSDAATRRALDEIETARPWVQVERHARNGGRGAALQTGYRLAARRGFSHVVQLDADGQHDPRDVPALLEVIRRRPEALVLGEPLFDASAPWARRYGRWISRFWVWVETCSQEIRDPLCGLRALPLAATLRVLARDRCGTGMDFDPEIIVRLVWMGVPVVNVPVRIRYFPDGVSHFHMFWDNLRFTWLHTRLFFGMLLRSPGLLTRQFRSAA